MPASLSTLPTEIINQIIGGVEESSSLLNAASTCHILHDLTIPHLYSDVQLIHDDSCYPHLRPFSVRMVKYPELASHINSFTLGNPWGTAENPAGFEGVEELDDAVLRTVHRFSQSPEEEEDWIQDLKAGGNEDAWLGLLIPSLRNLQRLDLWVTEMDNYCTWFARIMHRTLDWKKPSNAHPALSSLNVMINECNAEYDDPLGILSSFLKLPALTEYYCQRLGSYGDEPDTNLARLKTTSSALIHLEMRRSRLSVEDLTSLLRITKNLRTFVYELGDSRTNGCNYSTPGLRQAIAQIDNSLENLWLDYTSGPYCFHNSDDLVPIDSLANFKHLKNIKVGMYVLFGLKPGGLRFTGLDNTEVDFDNDNSIINLGSVLPMSIETIYFSHTNGRVRLLTRALEMLLQQKESATPKLKRVAFEAYLTGNPEKFDFDRLDTLSEEASVRVDRIDGAARIANDRKRWEFSRDVEDRGQGMDGSLKWAAQIAIVGSRYSPLFINAGR